MMPKRLTDSFSIVNLYLAKQKSRNWVSALEIEHGE